MTERSGFSMLEFSLAMVVFGIGLTGLFPLLITQSKHIAKLESCLPAGTTHYLVPAADPWARKLGATAQLTDVDPGPPAVPPVMLMNDGDIGYSEFGVGWGAETKKSAFRGDQRRHASGTGTDLARWQFTGLVAGWYDVRVTWLEAKSNASNAAFTVFAGATKRETVVVDQQIAPVGPSMEDRPFQSLGVYSIGGDSLRIDLSDEANGVVLADGVWIVPVRNVIQVLSLTKSLTTDDVTAKVIVQKLVPQ